LEKKTEEETKDKQYDETSAEIQKQMELLRREDADDQMIKYDIANDGSGIAAAPDSVVTEYANTHGFFGNTVYLPADMVETTMPKNDPIVRFGLPPDVLSLEQLVTEANLESWGKNVIESIPNTRALISPTSFEHTFLGSYSLLNLINGRAWNYGAELTAGTAAKAVVGIPAANAIAQGGGAALSDAGLFGGLAVTAVVTGIDVTDRVITNSWNEAVQTLPVNDPIGSPGVNMGGGVYWQEEWPHSGY